MFYKYWTLQKTNILLSGQPYVDVYRVHLFNGPIKRPYGMLRNNAGGVTVFQVNTYLFFYVSYITNSIPPQNDGSYSASELHTNI